ncbi:MAG: DUF2723 domain-containing protein [Cyanobacteria bacterium NC_groundwater_1444_Ag_S-0.65um_54_12]|nr:DUF2723 domain-containing protein [Cyanobacteria bacterium NC_groundwater_1444_Ag_S-0.65um_54_12]
MGLLDRLRYRWAATAELIPTTAGRRPSPSCTAAEKSESFKAIWVGVIAGLLVFLAYLPTVQRGLGNWDVGEFQTVPYILGIAHPTGYPFYTLLGKVWLILMPVGSVAYRMNLLSAVCAAGAVGILGFMSRRFAGTFIALASALTFGLAPYYWRVALRADPHALNALMVLGLLALCLAWAKRREPWLLGVLAFWSGLSLGNHLLILMLFPAVAILVLTTAPTKELTGKFVAALAGLFSAGLSVYWYLPLRSLMNPPLNYGHPTTLERFLYLVSGSQFRGHMHFLSLEGIAHFGQKLAQYPAYLQTWYTGPGAALIGLFAICGLGWLCTKHWQTALFLGLAFLVPLYAASNYENADLDRYHFPAHAVLLLCAAIGSGAIWKAWQTKPRVLLLLPLLALILPLILWQQNHGKFVQEAQDDWPRRFMEAVFRSAPENGVILSWWSVSTPLWYGRWVEGRRPDLLIVDDRNLYDDNWDGDFFKVVQANLGKRPIVTLYQEHDLARLRAAGYQLTEFSDPQFGHLGFLLQGKKLDNP